MEYLNSQFNNRINFFLGDAIETLSNFKTNYKYDLIHIDADHNENAVIQQFNNTLPLATTNAYYIFDDYEAVNLCIDNWILKGTLKHINTPRCLWTNIITQLNTHS